jgi:four helix bundle protein
MSTHQDLKLRTKDYALRIIRLYRALPVKRDGVAKVLGNQFLRAATSVAAHYREAYRAKSDADFVSKVEGAQQELEECDLWLELFADTGTIKKKRLVPLRGETNELMAIFSTMANKVKRRKQVGRMERREENNGQNRADSEEIDERA